MLSQRVTMLVEGVALVGELYFAAQEEAPVVVLCHGLPAGPPDPADPGYPFLAQRLARSGFTALAFNFRGAGFSGGNLGMAGWVRDLTAVLGFLEAGLGGVPATLMGFSAGAAVACRVASEDQRVSAVALMACPAGFEHLRRPQEAQAMLEHCRKVGTVRDSTYPPSLSDWVEGFVRLDPVGCIGSISPRPLLIVHGEADDLVPVANARRLFDTAGEPKEMVLLPGVGHRLRREEKVVAAALEWLQRVAA